VVKRTDASIRLVQSDKGIPNILNEEIRFMLWTILIVLLLLWLVGFYGGFVTSSLIHLLLVAAVIVLALNLFKSRSPA